MDKNFCIGFREYLLQKVSQNTAHTYFARLKAVLNQVVEREIINTNLSRFSQIKKTDVYKEFLTVDDLRKLKKTPCYNQETKNAFLFSCYTGLRFSDIDSLRFKDIEDGYINFKQRKTKGYERIKLSKNAIAIINTQREGGIPYYLLMRLTLGKPSSSHPATHQPQSYIDKFLMINSAH